MTDMNRLSLCGRLGRDPETRATSTGGKVVTFGLATSETWKDKASGDRRERTQWHNVVIFDEHHADVASKYLHKGDQVLIEGAMEYRKYTDKTGVERTVAEVALRQFGGFIQLLNNRRDGAPSPDSYGTTTTRPASNSYASAKNGDAPPAGRTAEQIDDDIPF